AFYFPDVSLSPGDNDITIQALDIAGNVSSETKTFNRVQTSGQTDPVLDWNQQALEAIRLDDQSAPEATRALAIMHSPILDVVNAIEGTPARYVSIPAAPGTSAVAAVAAAAHRVLSHIYPAQQAAFDAALAYSLSQIPDGDGKANGIALGEAIADAII